MRPIQMRDAESDTKRCPKHDQKTTQNYLTTPATISDLQVTIFWNV